ncbi:hypothetical protein KOSB73_10069 [Klebsiella grimontii]|uniref:Uncharacterized protein n=1 Tax=Klebsiella grimontii TaxID=2058152 RepID=A0A285AUV1_9ENTR|nr:hypothetical protein KOSB73_10069 [Klebsiella grimontii]
MRYTGPARSASLQARLPCKVRKSNDSFMYEAVIELLRINDRSWPTADKLRMLKVC